MCGAAVKTSEQQRAHLAGFGIDVPSAQQLQDSLKVTVRVEGSQSRQHDGCVARLVLLVSIAQACQVYRAISVRGDIIVAQTRTEMHDILEMRLSYYDYV